MTTLEHMAVLRAEYEARQKLISDAKQRFNEDIRNMSDEEINKRVMKIPNKEKSLLYKRLMQELHHRYDYSE